MTLLLAVIYANSWWWNSFCWYKVYGQLSSLPPPLGRSVDQSLTLEFQVLLSIRLSTRFDPEAIKYLNQKGITSFQASGFISAAILPEAYATLSVVDGTERASGMDTHRSLQADTEKVDNTDEYFLSVNGHCILKVD